MEQNDTDDAFAQGVLAELARRGASPAGLSLAVQLLGVGPCPSCGFRKLYCRCLPATTTQPTRYTCIGKGGSYELLGEASGAGILKPAPHVAIYRDTATGALYFRELDDFAKRMEPLP